MAGSRHCLDHVGQWPLFFVVVIGLVGTVGYFETPKLVVLVPVDLDRFHIRFGVI